MFDSLFLHVNGNIFQTQKCVLKWGVTGIDKFSLNKGRQGSHMPILTRHIIDDPCPPSSVVHTRRMQHKFNYMQSLLHCCNVYSTCLRYLRLELSLAPIRTKYPFFSLESKSFRSTTFYSAMKLKCDPLITLNRV